MTKRVLILAVVAGALAVGFATSAPARAVPPVSWTPPALSFDATAGTTTTQTASFTASANLGATVLEVVPELSPFVSVSPPSLQSVAKGQTVTVTVTAAPSATTSLGVREGTIKLRSATDPNKIYAKPLPLTLEIVSPRVEEEDISFEYPGTWRVDPTPRELGKVIELVNFPSWLHGGIVPPGGAAIIVSVFPLESKPLQVLIDEDMEGQTVRQVVETTVGGENATKVESVIDFGGFSEDRVTVFAPHEQSLYKFILMYRSGDPRASEFAEVFGQVLNTTTFN